MKTKTFKSIFTCLLVCLIILSGCSSEEDSSKEKQDI